MALAACSDVTVDDRWPTYTVVGDVIDERCKSIAGVQVWITTYPAPDCGTGESYVGPFTTDVTGRYRGSFATTTSAFEGCVELRAVPPAATGLAELTVRTGLGKLDYARRDSLIVGVRLSPVSP